MQLPWLVNLTSLVCDVDGQVSGRVSALESEVAGSISSGEDHGIRCWWDLIKSKQLSCVSVCHVKVFAEFSSRANSIPNCFLVQNGFFRKGSYDISLKRANVYSEFKKINTIKFMIFIYVILRKSLFLLSGINRTNFVSHGIRILMAKM